MARASAHSRQADCLAQRGVWVSGAARPGTEAARERRGREGVGGRNPRGVQDTASATAKRLWQQRHRAETSIGRRKTDETGDVLPARGQRISK